MATKKIELTAEERGVLRVIVMGKIHENTVYTENHPKDCDLQQQRIEVLKNIYTKLRG